MFAGVRVTENEDHQGGFCGLLKRMVAILFSETSLKFHLFTYWLFCLFDMIEEQPHSLHVIKVMLVAMAIIFALLATVTRAVCLFYPFLFVIVFEFTKYLSIFLLLALKLAFPEKYNALISTQGLSHLKTFTKNTRSEDEIYYVWSGFCVVYFVLVSLTLIRNITDYQWRERMRHHRENVYPHLMTPVPMRRLVLQRELEVGDVNTDEPPPYSAAVQHSNLLETAKEETDPPRYSQLGYSQMELPLDRTKSECSEEITYNTSRKSIPLRRTNSATAMSKVKRGHLKRLSLCRSVPGEDTPRMASIKLRLFNGLPPYSGSEMTLGVELRWIAKVVLILLRAHLSILSSSRDGVTSCAHSSPPPLRQESICIISCYSPTSAVDKSELDAFHGYLEEVIRNDKFFYKFVVGDFNAKLAKATGEEYRIGRLELGDRIENANRLAELLSASFKDLPLSRKTHLFQESSLFMKNDPRWWT
ncbi:hypothetical protein RB195_010997 [Necator americanus]|uniref:Uncharacterized protein n=1 Tax=Necator americanus TaxID=51031 RepID=A0ABR1D0E8_NECAM